MKRVNNIIKAAAAFLMAMSLSGCIGKEPNEIAYVVALGIDKGVSGNYNITIQYVNPTKISGGDDKASSEGNIAETIVIDAPNIYAALGLADRLESKTFSYSHVKLVVFSQEIAENGIKNIAESLIRSEEFRPDIYLAVARNSALEYLDSIDPAMEINPAKYYQMIFEKNNVVGLPEGIEKNFFIGTETDDYDSLLPIVGVITDEEGNEEDGEGGGKDGGEDSEKENDGGKSDNNMKENDEKKQEMPVNEEPFEYKMRNYVAGENDITLKTKSEAIGGAVFKGDKMVGILGAIDTEVYKLLDSDYNYSYITLYNEQDPNVPVTIKTVQKKYPKYDIDILNKKVNIKIELDGDIYYIPWDYDIEKNPEEFEDRAEKYIEDACEKLVNKVIKDYKSDIFRFNERTKKKFLTNADYKAFKENVDYSEYEISVEAELKIKRTGLIVRGM